MNLKNLKASLPATMAGIASKAGLRLGFGQPRTDGKTIWVSDIPVNPTIDDYNVVVSDLIHEIGHVKYTDFSVDRTEHKLMPALSNVFEDVRIEKELQSEFLGAKNYLNEGYKVILKKGETLKPDTPSNALSLWLLTQYMIDVNGRDFFSGERDSAYQELLQFGVSEEILDSIQNLCDKRVATLGSVQDVIQLSREVIELLQEAKDEEEQENQENGQGQSDEQDDSNGSGQSDTGSSDDSDTDDVQNSEGGASSEGSDSEKADSGSSDDSDSTTEDSTEDSNSNNEIDSNGSQDASDSEQKGCTKNGAKELLESDVNNDSPISLRDLTEQIAQNLGSDNSYVAVAGQTDDLAQELKLSSTNNGHYYRGEIQSSMLTYNGLKDAPQIQRLKAQIRKVWTNQSKTRQRVNEFDGRFDCQEAIRCQISNESNYLVKRSRKTDHKPAVCILADLSGSMQGENIQNQTKALIALSEACDAVKMPLNIIGFSDYCYKVKDWNDSMSKARAKIGGANTTISGTDIVPAVYEGIKALSHRKEEKKILIVMTDGAIGGAKYTLANLLENTQKTMKGFEAYGLGLGVSLGDLFPKGGVIEPAKIADSILEILTQ